MKRFIDIIYLKSPLQKKRLTDFLETCGEEYWKQANEFAENFNAYLDSVGLTIEYAADSYIKVCNDVLAEQVKFLKTGKYSCNTVANAYENIYSNENVMRYYMIGVALTQFLWEPHYAMFTFFNDILTQQKDSKDRKYLEIGAGHGMFIAQAMNILNSQTYKIVDISSISLSICKGILNYLAPNKKLPEMVNMNALDIKDEDKYDFVTMGEVIEHVEDPRPLLRKIADVLKPDGHAFLTTCANSPAIDHIYLFNNVQEIRDLFNSCGLKIEKELIIPAEKRSQEELERFKISISYAALVKRM